MRRARTTSTASAAHTTESVPPSRVYGAFLSMLDTHYPQCARLVNWRAAEHGLDAADIDIAMVRADHIVIQGVPGFAPVRFRICDIERKHPVGDIGGMSQFHQHSGEHVVEQERLVLPV